MWMGGTHPAAGRDIWMADDRTHHRLYSSETTRLIGRSQRQRLAPARALANHPVILPLDEATSALGVVTEQVVERNLHMLRGTTQAAAPHQQASYMV